MVDKPSRGAQARGGLGQAILWLMGLGWLFLVFSGLGIAFLPSPYPSGLGWTFLAIAAIVMLLTMDWWVKIFPALLSLATINSTSSVLTGHLTGNPSASITRKAALIAAMLLASSTILSFRFIHRKLRVLDRIAVFVFVVCICWQVIEPRATVIAPSLAVAFLAMAWTYDRVQRAHHPH